MVNMGSRCEEVTLRVFRLGGARRKRVARDRSRRAWPEGARDAVLGGLLI